MSDFSLTKVHEYVRVPGTQEVRLIKTRPYSRLRSGDTPPIFVQEGKFYSEAGDEYPREAVPAWVRGQLMIKNDQGLAEIGLMRDELPDIGMPGNVASDTDPVKKAVDPFDEMDRKALLKFKKLNKITGKTRGVDDDGVRDLIRKALSNGDSGSEDNSSG